MPPSGTTPNGTLQQWVVVRPEPPGQFSAELLGLPEVRATAATREEVLQQIDALLNEWINSGRLVSIEVTEPNPLLSFAGRCDPNDPLEQEYMEELARFRREDLERTLRENEQECRNSSSTPTT